MVNLKAISTRLFIMEKVEFNTFFQDKALHYLTALIDLALEEDGRDLTSEALFSPEDRLSAVITAKQHTLVAGLPLFSLILERIPGFVEVDLLVSEGASAAPKTRVARFEGLACKILKAERIMLNFLSRLSGIASLTRTFVQKLEGTNVTLLDTRKTTPGLRYPEKYAVLIGGGKNHRLDLESMLMLKDNHIDRAGSIRSAVKDLRLAYKACPPIEVECRSLEDVREAVDAQADRIMLDNLDTPTISRALKIIHAAGLESEVSGGVTLENIARIAALGPTYISAGALTHSSVAADFSMSIDTL